MGGAASRTAHAEGSARRCAVPANSRPVAGRIPVGLLSSPLRVFERGLGRGHGGVVPEGQGVHGRGDQLLYVVDGYSVDHDPERTDAGGVAENESGAGAVGDRKNRGAAGVGRAIPYAGGKRLRIDLPPYRER